MRPPITGAITSLHSRASTPQPNVASADRRAVDDLKSVAKEFGDVDMLLKSPIDGQPYVIVWGVDLGNAANPTMVVAHEKIGAGGVRYVMTPTGVRKLTDVEFARGISARIQAARPVMPIHRPLTREVCPHGP